MVYQLYRKQFLPISIDEAWEFFSSPKNLKTITPGYIGFEIKSGAEHPMFAGQLITYTVRPLFGIPMGWVTEICHVDAPNYFVDNQRFGPYAMWHHKHFFKSVEGGIMMEDIVDYKLPFGILGRIAHYLFVKKKLKQIFDFREEKLKALYG